MPTQLLFYAQDNTLRHYCQENAQEAQHVFICKVVETEKKIVSFVNNCLGQNEDKEFLNYFKDSFSLSIAVRNKETTKRALFASRFGRRYTSRGD